MAMNRRSMLGRLAATAAAIGWRVQPTEGGPIAADEPTNQGRTSSIKKIATEEAFTIPELIAPMREVLARGGHNLDLTLLRTIYADDVPSEADQGTVPAGSNRDALARQLLPRLLDIDRQRIADMDASGVDVHVLSLFMPGVQFFPRDTATALARTVDDRLADAVRRHPTRFAGLASVAPQDPAQRRLRSNGR